MFTKEIEEALYSEKIDLAVHSLKDLPTALDESFAIAAIPPRADPSDAFVSVDYDSFAALSPGARIGTSSLRRQAQLRAQRGDLHYIEFRGNVDTRLRKLSEGEVAAIILASAGLERLGRTEYLRERFPPLILCPAAGQGARHRNTRHRHRNHSGSRLSRRPAHPLCRNRRTCRPRGSWRWLPGPHRHLLPTIA